MPASKDTQVLFDVDQLLRKLYASRTAYQSLFTASAAVPLWATQYTKVLYSPKSVPTVFTQQDIFYLYYRHPSHELGLVGETSQNKRIDRILKVTTQGSSITIRSIHKNFKTNSFETFEGRGMHFEAALNDYFSKSDLRAGNYSFNRCIHQNGDAFLLKKRLSHSGFCYITAPMTAIIKKLFQLIPTEQHPQVFAMIEKDFNKWNKILDSSTRELFAHYDLRLWVIIEAIFKYFDHDELDLKRTVHRDHFIANCCRGLLKEEDISNQVEKYVSVLQRHHQLIQEYDDPTIAEHLKELLKTYRDKNYLPEISEQGEKIELFFSEYQQLKEQGLRHGPP